MRVWLCLALAACGTDSEPAPPVVRPPGPPPAPAKVTPPPLTAAHGSEIVALGVTADGAAVASADRLGGLRLWPALDGAREPIVIHGTAAAHSVALARDGDGFALSTLDDAGGLHIMRISAAGAVRERITVAGDQPTLEIAGTPEGLLILRADQTLELVDGTGQVRSRLAPDPGMRVDSILVRDARALALVQEGKRVHGQWIELDHGMHWGESTPRFSIKIAHAVLSPDGDVIAVTRPRSVHPVLIDLATGTPRKTPLCVAKDWPQDSVATTEGELLRGDNAPVPLGFFTGALVACSVMGALQWWTTAGSPQSTAGSIAIGKFPVGVSGRGLVIGMGPSLALATPTSNRFLGYGLHDPAQLRSGPSGLLISGGDLQALVLDPGLRERSRFELGRNPMEWRDAILLDDRYAITVSPRRNVDARSDIFQLAVFDGVARVQHQVLSYEVRDKALMYEPSTGLLTTSDIAGAMLLQLDPITHTFGKPIRIASWIPPSRVVVLDPRLAGGVAALEIDDAGDGILAGEFPLADIQPSATIMPRRIYRVPGELRAVDRTGRLYMHGKYSEEVVVYARGVAVARLPGLAGMSLRPSPDGSQIAAFQAPRLVLMTSAGQVRWEAALWSSTDIAWTASGDLVAQFASGLARVDLQTGALAERRCGWSFGLSELPFDAANSGPTICDVAR